MSLVPGASALPPPVDRSGVKLTEVPKPKPVPGVDGGTLERLTTADIPTEPEYEPKKTAAPASVPPAARTLTALTPGQTVPIGTTPLEIGAPKEATPAEAAALEGSWQVALTDQAQTEARNIEGFAFTVTPPATATGNAVVALDYTEFAELYGANWADRLNLLQFPSCFLTTPDVEACSEPVEVDTRNVVTPKTGDASGDHVLDGERQLEATLNVATLTDPAAPPAPAARSLAGKAAAPMSASVAAAAGSSVLVATSSGSGAKGDFSATPIPSAGSWSAGNGAGAFTYSYAMQAPSVPAGPSPALGFGYNSQTVDGATSATNNQPSWIGDGWDYNPGAITRTYRSCRDDMKDGNNKKKTADLCWGSYNAVLSLGGSTTELVLDDSHTAPGAAGPYSDKWVTANGDGSKVELIKRSGTDARSEGQDYWKVTTRDGTQYWFGRHKLPNWTEGKETTNSVLTVPVSGNQDKEPCYNATYANSFCYQAWRWNLDYVVDVHGNAMSLWWKKEENHYARNFKFKAPVDYDRGGYLTRIDYGQQEKSLFTADPVARVNFSVEERCYVEDGLQCTDANFTSGDWAKNRIWYDTPADLYCSGAKGKECYVPVPSFWSRKRLAAVTTYAQRVQGSTALSKVDNWKLVQSLPHEKTDEGTALWLNSVTRTGYGVGDDTGVKLNPVTFVANTRSMPNRVKEIVQEGPDKGKKDTNPIFDRLRLSRVVNEYGGETIVTYRDPSGACLSGEGFPKPEENKGLCFPAYWHPDPDKADESIDWFNKYVVAKIEELPNVDGVDPTTTTYEYDETDPVKRKGTAWALNQAEFSKKKTRTYDQWRGYELVRTVSGADSAHPYTGSERSMTATRYFRGMDGDKLPGAGNPVRNVSVLDSKGVKIADDLLPYQGRVAETMTYTKYGGTLISRDVDYPKLRTLASRARGDGIPDLKAYRVLEDRSVTVTAASGTRKDNDPATVDDDRRERTVETTTSYEGTYDLPVQVESKGDDGRTGDETCSRMEYVHNTGKHLIGLSKQALTTTGLCPAAGTEPPASAWISGSRVTYDNLAYGAAPTAGLATTTWTVNKDGGSWDKDSEVGYDDLARPVRTVDAAGNPSTTEYIPPAGQVHSVKTTNAKLHSSISVIEPGRATALKETDPNGRTTTFEYDGLGRTVKAWGPTHTAGRPGAIFTYYAEPGDPVSVRSEFLKEDRGTEYVSSYAFYDGLGRERQKQEPAVGKGRLITDVFYGPNGTISRTNNAYFVGDEPQPVMYQPADASDTKIPNATLYKYDGLGRILQETPYEAGTEKPEKANRSEFGEDYSVAIEPNGAASQRSYSDALGRTVRIDTFTDPARTAFRSTNFSYDARGDLINARDPKGNTWSWTYDVRGRLKTATDPDAGTSSTEYDLANRPVLSTDGRGVKVWTKYDELSRAVEQRLNDDKGDLLRTSTYDTVAGAVGLPASVTRYTDKLPYVSQITGYTADYQPTGKKLTLPDTVATAHGLQQTYSYSFEYTQDGQLKQTMLPAAGSLAAEKIITRYNADGLPVSTSGKEWYTTDTEYSVYGQVVRTVSGANPSRVWTTNVFNESTGALEESIVDRQSTSDTTAVTGNRVNSRTYQYDNAGNITSIADRWNAVTDRQCFTYDSIGQMTEAWTAPSTCQAPGKPGAAPAYPDGTKNVTAANSGYWQTYTYDELGQRTKLVKHDAAGDATKDSTTTYTYGKADGSQPHTLTGTSTTFKTEAGAQVTKPSVRTYDKSGNMESRTDGGVGQALTWTWDGKVEKVTGFGEGSGAWTGSTGKCLDLAGGLTIAGTAIQQYVCNGSKAQKLRIDATVADPTVGALKVVGKCVVPGSDGIAAVIADCTGTAAQHWTSVAEGKKLKHVDSNKCLTAPNDTSGTDLQLTACAAAGAANQEWKPSDETRYVYGPDGERLLAITASETTLFLGDTTVATSRGLPSYTERYYGQPGAPTVMRHVLGNGGSGEVSVQIADSNGTASINVALTAGNAVKFARKDPFGVDRHESPSWRSHKGYVGGDEDSSTGLVHLGAREYEPATGRFISVDPLLDIADPVQSNGYTYSENSPVTFADPTGLVSAAQGGGGGGGGYNGDQYGGPSKGELAWAQQEQNRSMASVIADAGWSLLKGLIGYDDMVACFSRGDLWACGSMILDAIPWTKVFTAGKRVWNAVSKIAGAISAWRAAQEKARNIIAMARKAQEAARKAAEAKKKAAEKAAQLKKKRAEQAKLRAAKKEAQKTGNAVQKAKKVAAKKAEKPISRARQQAKKDDAPSKSGKSGNRSGSTRDESSGSSGGSCKNPNNSFVPGTLVLMADGSTKPIEEVRNGDKVVATDPETGETAIETVTAEIKGEGEKKLVQVTIDTDGAEGSATAVVTATDGHPFWVPELREWIDATDLAAGDWLRTGAGTLVQITAVERRTAQATVHNLTVSDLHTYYVLAEATPVLVHNCGPEAKAAAQSAPEGATMSAAARFRDTGMVSTGYSGHRNGPSYFEPEIDEALGDGGQIAGRGADNCAEIRACNNLIAEHGAEFEEQVGRSLQLSDIEFLTVRTATGAPEAACLSCQSVLVRRGATDLSR
ncbi:polymorphic toxin-type HINT domain-containing protein [Streptomyces sp. NPDC006798]|uniref:polymorphic toxin-type HINT domain-containing protein n=1 Tax=Streptomyces sp. NPDC006798 TaxID=3155462 RepID=UPI0033EE6F70